LQLQWVDPATGMRKTRSAKTEDPDIAEQRRADLEYELNHGLHADPLKVSWDVFREAFEDEYLSGRRLNTQKGYTATFNLFEELATPGLLSAITARTVSQFVAVMRKLPGKDGQPFKPATLSIRLTQLGSALAWAKQQGMLAEVPEFPSVTLPKKRPQPVPVSSVERLLSASTDPQMTAYILCGWEAGMRRDEAYGLQWEENGAGDGFAPYLNLPMNRIIFPAESAKGKEDQWLPISARLRQALDKLKGRSGPVFNFMSVRNRPLSSMAVVARLTKLAETAGVPLTMRTLRRGFGCRYAGEVAAHVLQRLMRHSSIDITMQFYANVDESIEKAILGINSGNSPATVAFPAAPEPANSPLNRAV
jgi:integrase